jgi:hypothetical protein
MFETLFGEGQYGLKFLIALLVLAIVPAILVCASLFERMSSR